MLHFFFLVVILLFLLYTLLILYYRAAWLRLNEHKFNKEFNPKIKVSIIIPARNEAQNIGNLLDDIFDQYYPPELMEVIVIDDHSTDNTSEIVTSYAKVKYISLANHTQGQILNSYKKRAIETAIMQSSGELIITTDADCRMCGYWLSSIVNFYEVYRYELIASPVLFTSNEHWFQIFQSIDFMTMQGITAALSFTKSGTMCNGANLAYTRKAFETVNGFKGIDDIASGDDMLLMYKIEKQFPKRTAYLKCKDAIVYTAPMHTIKSFIQQRTRWASKATKFEDKRIRFVLALVYLFNLLYPLTLIGGFFNIKIMGCFISLLVGKTIIELFLLIPVATFFKKRRELFLFPFLQIVHIIYILYAGIKGQSGSYEWKERQVK